MDKEQSKIHFNPAFFKQANSNSKIHVNPSFVNRSFLPTQSDLYPYGRHVQEPFYQHSTANFNEHYPAAAPSNSMSFAYHDHSIYGSINSHVNYFTYSNLHNNQDYLHGKFTSFSRASRNTDVHIDVLKAQSKSSLSSKATKKENSATVDSLIQTSSKQSLIYNVKATTNTSEEENPPNQDLTGHICTQEQTKATSDLKPSEVSHSQQNLASNNLPIPNLIKEGSCQDHLNNVDYITSKDSGDDSVLLNTPSSESLEELNKTEQKDGKYFLFSRTKLIRRTARQSPLAPMSNLKKSSNAKNSAARFKIISRAKLVRRRTKSISPETERNRNKKLFEDNSLDPKLGNNRTRSLQHFKTPSKFSLLTRNKLIRRSSSRSNLSNTPNYLLSSQKSGQYKTTFKNNLVAKLKSPSEKYGISKYHVLSKNKLIREKSNSAIKDSINHHSSLRRKNVLLAFSSPNRALSKKDLKSHKCLLDGNMTHPAFPQSKLVTSGPSREKINVSKFKFLSRNKLIRKSLSSDKSPTSNYKLITRNKLIRRNSLLLTPEMKKTFDHPKTRMKLVKSKINPNISYVVLREDNGNIKFAIKTETKLINKKIADLKVMDFIQPYLPLDHGKGSNAPNLKKNYSSFMYFNKKKRWIGTSDKFINIGGSLYKTTSTSLKKYEIKSPSTCRRRISSEKSRHLKPGALIEIARKKKWVELHKRNEQCSFFAKTGKCKRQELGTCPFQHDSEKLAICTKFLMGKCSSSSCPFAHHHDKSRMPVCSHFMKGGCTRADCLYRHVRVNPDAPICLSFLRGVCLLGEECKKKHIIICEEFKEKGFCNKGRNCPLSHPRPKKPNKILKLKRRRMSTSVSKSFLNSSKKQKKIGVLGLASSTEKKQTRIPYKQDGNRYFDNQKPLFENYLNEEDPANIQFDPQGQSESDLESPLKLESVDINNDIGGQKYSPAFKDKRDRMMKRVNKLKELYIIGIDICTDSHAEKVSIPNITKYCSDKEKILNTLQDHNKEDFRYGHIPLPDLLPDFIPLVLAKD